ncbi:hypothetical protein EJ357_47485 [Streptomyces cyaneochromogenes]|uniref:Uncharacterized protein n=1 Tax=Streptomyces cyaneochromogenes TaxID=2496836 RepID=A0A3Q9F089_9ACTN|nr:hypothetical protein [Streptomyces cyaneochromogenes]AZQ32140.1 hypothetical protein EJ357_00445 [Streptomyces cyaneochromogenes]AZQ40083.1 hypothetical protein EJ357_47485 [Streptomyces cyaneochromogenes]
MASFQIRDTTTCQLLARGLPDYPAAEAAIDRIDDQLEHDLQHNNEHTGRIRLDIEKVTAGITEPVGHHILLIGVDDTPRL